MFSSFLFVDAEKGLRLKEIPLEIVFVKLQDELLKSAPEIRIFIEIEPVGVIEKTPGDAKSRDENSLR